MPDNSPFSFGFAFVYRRTGNPCGSRRRQLVALRKFFESQGEDDGSSEVRIIARWRNPADKAERSQRWKTTEEDGQSLADFYATVQENRGLLTVAEERVNAEYEAMRDARYARAGAVQRKTRRPKGSPRAIRDTKKKVSRASLGKTKPKRGTKRKSKARKNGKG